MDVPNVVNVKFMIHQYGVMYKVDSVDLISNSCLAHKMLELLQFNFSYILCDFSKDGKINTNLVTFKPQTS